MQVDGDAAYIGQHDYDYYDCSYFQQFVGDLGMVANFSLKVLEISEEPEFKKPKKYLGNMRKYLWRFMML